MLRVCSSALVLVALLSTCAFGQTRVAQPASAPGVEKAPLINLNTATVVELEQLPGIGAKVAARIVEYRTKKGPFHKVEELMNVQGIGEKSFLKLKPQLTVAGTASTASQ